MTIRRGIHNTTTGRNVDSPISWAYADAAARLAATGFKAIDVGRFAWQQDDNSVWMLLTVAPTWVEITQSAIASNYLKLDASNDPITGQLALNIATGTSPFAITSTTVNTNLNADLLDGLHDTAFPILAPGASTRNVIQPSGDFKALIIKNNASQAENPFELQTSAGTVMAYLSANGTLDVTGALYRASGNTLYVHPSYQNLTSDASAFGVLASNNFTTNNNNTFRGFAFDIRQTGVGNATSYTEGINVTMRNTGAGTVNYMDGFKFYFVTSGGGIVTNARGIVIYDPTPTSGTFANVTGIQIAAITAGTVSNYAIQTSTGTVLFGDKVVFTQIDGNEYIDSLADGYLDIGATTQIRLLADTYIGAKNIVTDTTTGTKIGANDLAKVAMYNATPIVRQDHIADATDAGSAITQLNLLIAAIENFGILKTS